MLLLVNYTALMRKGLTVIY